LARAVNPSVEKKTREVHVVSVASDHEVAAKHADRAIEFLASHKIRAVPTAAVSSDAPAATLLDRARVYGAGLIVMGVHGQPLVMRGIWTPPEG
jgi:nucleotide-binding universal stress UspA family protein